RPTRLRKRGIEARYSKNSINSPAEAGNRGEILEKLDQLACGSGESQRDTRKTRSTRLRKRGNGARCSRKSSISPAETGHHGSLIDKFEHLFCSKAKTEARTAIRSFVFPLIPRSARLPANRTAPF